MRQKAKKTVEGTYTYVIKYRYLKTNNKCDIISNHEIYCFNFLYEKKQYVVLASNCCIERFFI